LEMLDRGDAINRRVAGVCSILGLWKVIASTGIDLNQIVIAFADDEHVAAFG